MSGIGSSALSKVELLSIICAFSELLGIEVEEDIVFATDKARLVRVARNLRSYTFSVYDISKVKSMLTWGSIRWLTIAQWAVIAKEFSYQQGADYSEESSPAGW